MHIRNTQLNNPLFFIVISLLCLGFPDQKSKFCPIVSVRPEMIDSKLMQGGIGNFMELSH